MPQRWLGVTVSGDALKLVDAEIPDDDKAAIVVQSDQTWPLQQGDRSKAYDVVYRQLANYAKEHGVSRAVVKASATGKNVSMKLSHLQAAELRGVAICALASVTEVECISKGYISRTFGERKADEYLKDNEFWSKEVTGANVRVGSREAALVILAARQSDE